MAVESIIKDALTDGALAFAKVSLPTMSHQIGLMHATIESLESDPNLEFHRVGGSYPEKAPMPKSFGVKREKHLTGSYLFIHLHGRFFHDFLESLSYAWALKHAGETFTIVFVSKQKDVITKSGFPRGMFFGAQEYDKEHPDTYPQAFIYLMSFLSDIGMPYLFMSVDDIQDISCDYAYIPYVRMEPDCFTYHEAIDYIDCRRNKKLSRYTQPVELDQPIPGYYPIGPTTIGLSSSVLEMQIRLLRALFTPEYIGSDSVYVSRRGFADRSNPEEESLESYFSSIGYRIVYLEKYPVWTQIDIVTKAKNVAMFSGGSQALTYLCRPETSILWLRPKEYDLHVEKDMAKYFSDIQLNIDIIEFNPETDSIVSLVAEKFS